MALQNQQKLQKHRKFLYIIFILGLLIIQQIQCVHAQDVQKEPQQQQQQQQTDINNKNNAKNESNTSNSTKKKELKVDQSISVESVIKQQEPVKGQVIQIDEKSITETEQKVDKDHKLENESNKDDKILKEPIPEQKKITATSHKAPTMNDDNKSKIASSSSPLSSMSFHHHGETILNAEENISDSLKAGFYFFLALSSSAVLFIVFKIYRLRLSRAERKYGVLGDRSNQELTPLPVSIEDGHSDDEDQTLFDQRQNIRIL